MSGLLPKMCLKQSIYTFCRASGTVFTAIDVATGQEVIESQKNEMCNFFLLLTKLKDDSVKRFTCNDNLRKPN